MNETLDREKTVAALQLDITRTESKIQMYSTRGDRASVGHLIAEAARLRADLYDARR